MSNEAPTDALRLVPVNDDAPTNRKLAVALSNHPEVMVVERSDPSLELTERSLEEVLDELTAAPASPLPGGGWQDISTAPKDGTRVLIGRWIDYAPAWREWAVSVAYYESGRVGPMDSFHRQGWTETFAERGATHWMPLPAAPIGDA